MKNWNVEGNHIKIDGNNIEFSYTIEEAEEYKNMIVISLQYNSKYDPKLFANAVYAISQEGKILWQMEEVSKFNTEIELAPIVGIIIKEDNLIAIDYYSRRYYLNSDNGNIIKIEKGKW